MHVRHGLAAALGILLAAALAAPASAAVNADFSMGDLVVGMTASGDSARVFVDGPNIRVAEDSTITNGPPTLTTTSTIRFEDFSGGTPQTAVIDHSGGRFEPGPDESGDTDEIEFAFDMQAGDDVVRVILASAGQQVAVGNTGINFNPLEETPDDDVLGDLAAVESVVLQGGPGNDTITGSSTGAGVDTATKPLTITGGGGDDDLTGGNGPDSINSQDGDNNDVISCRNGADTATADLLDAVGTDCETINRPSTGGGGGTGGGGANLVDPTISALAFSPAGFLPLRSGPSILSARRGSRVTYGLSERARVAFAVERAAPGRRARRRCTRPTRRNRRARRCTRWPRLRGGFSHAGAAGLNSFRFSGRLRGRPLRPGRHRLVAVPVDLTGNRGKAARKSFRILRRR